MPSSMRQSMNVEHGPSSPSTGNRARSIDYSANTHSGTSLVATATGLGIIQNSREWDDSEGGKLTIFQGFMIVFCMAFGAGMAFVGWYPSLAGTYGFALLIVLVSGSGAIATNALHLTAIKTKSSNFAELCASLPSFASTITTYSQISWGFTIAALYVQFTFTFINNQILGGRFAESGIDSAGLYIPIGIVVFLATSPPKFGGKIVQIITNINLAVTWIVITTALVKGIHTGLTTPEEKRPKEYKTWDTSGFLRVMVLLSGAMFQCSPTPRIQYEMAPLLKEKAAVVIPVLLAVVQGTVFLIVGLIGYWALGDNIRDSGDVFDSYYYFANDFMVTILQGGIALLMFLSLPLLALPPKVELWALCAPDTEEGGKVPFEDAPLMAQLGLNLLLTLFATTLPMTVGKTNVTRIFTIMSGTAACWVNLFLPVFVIIYADVLPARQEGRPWFCSAAKSMWILFLALAFLYSSALDITALVKNLFS